MPSLASHQNSVFKGEEGAFVVLIPTSEPPRLPQELAPFISLDSWHCQVEAISVLSKQSSRPLLEALWCIVSLLLPLAVFFPLWGVYAKDTSRALTNGQCLAIVFGIVTTVSLLLWAPLLVWKFMYTRKANMVIQGWKSNHWDSKRILTWTVRLPGLCRSQGAIKVYLPANNGFTEQLSIMTEQNILFVPVTPIVPTSRHQETIERSLARRDSLFSTGSSTHTLPSYRRSVSPTTPATTGPPTPSAPLPTVVTSIAPISPVPIRTSVPCIGSIPVPPCLQPSHPCRASFSLSRPASIASEFGGRQYSIDSSDSWSSSDLSSIRWSTADLILSRSSTPSTPFTLSTNSSPAPSRTSLRPIARHSAMSSRRSSSAPLLTMPMSPPPSRSTPSTPGFTQPKRASGLRLLLLKSDLNGPKDTRGTYARVRHADSVSSVDSGFSMGSSDTYGYTSGPMSTSPVGEKVKRDKAMPWWGKGGSKDRKAKVDLAGEL